MKCLLLALYVSVSAAGAPLPSEKSIDRSVARILTRTKANGLAVAVIDDGQVRFVRAYGMRNGARQPLMADTVMYGASLTKAVFAHLVLKLVDRGVLNLDTPLERYLNQPLPSYRPYADLSGDARWKAITPRHCLTHSTGFANFAFLEPDGKLRIHFEPGTRYSYSGEGLILLQFVIEQGLGVSIGDLAEREFERLGMTRTSFKWRDDFAANLADGWNDRGEVKAHDRRSRVRAAGSMDTTISDIAKFAAALLRGDGLSSASRREITKRQLPITTAHQFPVLAPELPVRKRRKDLSAGLGVVVFDGPQGHAFYKGGHDEQTANTMVCLEKRQRCVVILSNDVCAEAGFADLVKAILGKTNVPYDWEYGDRAGKS